MDNLKARLIKTIAQIKEEKLYIDPMPGPTISWRIRSVFLESGVEIDDRIEGELLDIARLSGYTEIQPKWMQEKLSVQGFIDICDIQLRRILLNHLVNPINVKMDSN